MDRDALGPVAVFSLGVVLISSTAATTLEQLTDLPLLYVEAVSNGGLALVLVAVLVLFEWLSYALYRRKGARRVIADSVLVFVAAAVATVLVIGVFELTGFGDLAPQLGGLIVEVPSLLSGVVAFTAAVYLFYARNRDCYQSPQRRYDS